MSPSVAVLRLGCARNDADAEELAGRLAGDGWRLVTRADRADAVLVNTCAFIEPAARESVDTLLAAAGTGRPVVAVGCLAERHGERLAAAMPELAGVLGFDDYPQVSRRLRDVLAGRTPIAPPGRDRRRLLPVSPVRRVTADRGSTPLLAPRRRLTTGPVAALRLATGCDRRCAFCAIPTFRGRFVSRPPAEVVAEACWLAARGVRELYLVSENSTAYGKDLADPSALPRLLGELSAVPGVARVRLSYLQPAELRPALIDALTGTAGVVPYFDLSFQHAAGAVLRRMRRFGDGPAFLRLLQAVRRRAPQAGVRSNFVVGFPGETAADQTALREFLGAARLDGIGLFGYSDEEGTEAAGLPGKLSPAVIRRRVDRLSRLADELVAQRAAERVGETVDVLVESVQADRATGRAAHQGPEVDGVTELPGRSFTVGELVRARVVAASGTDLTAEPVVVAGGTDLAAGPVVVAAGRGLA